jgi:GNAT superfamily N-acetyltransferase
MSRVIFRFRKILFGGSWSVVESALVVDLSCIKGWTMNTVVEDVIFRKLIASDFEDAVALYKELSNLNPVADGETGAVQFRKILRFEGTTIYGAEVDGRIVSMATLHVLPNMTQSGRPYCLVENVVTLQTHQGRGLGRGVMNSLIQAAWDADSYKIMLLTGKARTANGFYEKLGFVGDQKHGMILRRVQ